MSLISGTASDDVIAPGVVIGGVTPGAGDDT